MPNAWPSGRSRSVDSKEAHPQAARALEDPLRTFRSCRNDGDQGRPEEQPSSLPSQMTNRQRILLAMAKVTA